jgi:hypothetical protein
VTARAHVEHAFAFGGVAIYLGRKVGDDIHVIEPVNLVVSVTGVGETQTVNEPTMRLDEDLARALLDALSAHFGGSSDVQTLRKDYLAERARVDKMIAHLTSGRGAAS